MLCAAVSIHTCAWAPSTTAVPPPFTTVRSPRIVASGTLDDDAVAAKLASLKQKLEDAVAVLGGVPGTSRFYTGFIELAFNVRGFAGDEKFGQ